MQQKDPKPDLARADARPTAQPKEPPHLAYRAVREYTYKVTPQGDLKMCVSFPFNWVESDRRPGIVFFFGGGWNLFRPSQFNRHAAYLASRGMVAACADYRVKSRHGVTPVECVQDAKSAVRWLRANAGEVGLDPARRIGAGGSSGAHLAACTTMCEGFDAAGEDLSISPAVSALVLFNPPLLIDAERAARFGFPEELAKRLSPLLHISRQTPPALLLYGTDDRLYADGRAFLEKSQEVGNPVEMYLAEGEGHGFFNFSPWFERTLYRVDEFLDSSGFLRGRTTFQPPE